jgi:hypothetical protein
LLDVGRPETVEAALAVADRGQDARLPERADRVRRDAEPIGGLAGREEPGVSFGDFGHLSSIPEFARLLAEAEPPSAAALAAKKA